MAYARPKGHGLVLASDGRVFFLQVMGTSAHRLNRYELDYSGISGQGAIITPTAEIWESDFARDMAVSGDGSLVYTAIAGHSAFEVYDGNDLNALPNLRGGTHTNNAEVNLNGIFFGGCTAWNGPTDIWVYNSSGSELTTYYVSGHSENVLDRQLVASSDGFRFAVLTTDPTIQFITRPE